MQKYYALGTRIFTLGGPQALYLSFLLLDYLSGTSVIGCLPCYFISRRQAKIVVYRKPHAPYRCSVAERQQINRSEFIREQNGKSEANKTSYWKCFEAGRVDKIMLPVPVSDGSSALNRRQSAVKLNVDFTVTCSSTKLRGRWYCISTPVCR